MQKKPIGVFDSGMGGLSVVKTIRSLLPSEDILYIGDSAYAPYGVREKADVVARSMAIGDELVRRSCKALVVACNTATSAAIGELRARYDLPVVGMEPALKVATEEVEGPILVLATELTLVERKFAALMERVGRSHEIYRQPAPEWVTLVEAGHLDDEQANLSVARVLGPYLERPPAAIVLGCTHFVFLRPLIEDFFPDAKVIDGNEGTVRQLIRLLEMQGELEPLETPGDLVIENTAGPELVDRSLALLEKSQLSSRP